MYTTVSAEVQFFIFSVVAGLASAFIYDILRISRRIVRVTDIVINLEDILFFAVAAILLFIAAYLKNSGEIRWQGLIGFSVGIGLYAFIIRDRFLILSTVIIKFIVKITGFLLKIILFPIHLIFKIFQKPINVIAWYTGKGVKRIKSAAKSRSFKLRLFLKNIKLMFRKS